MKKRIFISALIAFTLIFGNMTVFADNSDISLDDEYSYDEYADNYEYLDDYDDNYDYSSTYDYHEEQYNESFNSLRSYGYVGDDSNV